MNKGASGSNTLILAFFFLTGMTGLAYELVWIRLLVLAFGSTQFAVTTVLVTFMAGLALGSFLLGRLVDRLSAPLRAYGAVEIALGVYCVLSPFIFGLVRNIYLSLGEAQGAAHSAGFEFTQFALSFLALIIPATLMGGTLPILVKHLSSRSELGFSAAVPYAINTLGAVTGCLATGFFLLYVLGVSATIYAAGFLDILIGALVIFIYGKDKARAGNGHQRIVEESPVPIQHRKKYFNAMLLGIFAVSGFCSLNYEVLWTRIFSLVLGSSIYAFTIMLATFLAGIGIGSVIAAPLVDRKKNLLVWFFGLEAAIGLFALFSAFAYKKLPFIFYNMKMAFAGQFWLFLFLQFLLCAAVMIVPTLCMGAIFPVICRIYAQGKETVGKKVGEIYFYNTAGSIFGAFAGGFFFIPYIGVQNSVLITAGLNIALGIALLYMAGVKPVARHGLAIAFVAIFAVSAKTIPSWEKTVMTLGLYVNPVEQKEIDDIKSGVFKDSLVYYKEGINAIVTVRKSEGAINSISYQANGKSEARALNGRPPEAWALLGHLPLLLHKGEPRDSLLVGLGSGITLGAMQAYPLKSMDVVELEPAVVEAARFFSKENNNALSDPRVSMHLTDGRSFLFTGKKSYDIIVSAVSDPWITGVSNLFTYEYFNELKEKLNDNGVASLWFQNYKITPNELRIGLNTFASVFPYVSVWFHYTDSLDLIVIGSKEPHSFDMNALSRRLGDSGIKRNLELIGINDEYALMNTFLIGNDDLRGYIKGAPLNTDEKPVLEFTLPKLLYTDPELAVRMVEEMLANVKDPVPPVVLADEHRERYYIELAKTYNAFNFRLPQALALFDAALSFNPGNAEALRYKNSLEAELGRRRQNNL